MSEVSFPLDVGDSVTVLTEHGGAVFGFFTGWDRRGRALVNVPEYDRKHPAKVEPDRLRPCNDQRMVRKRGIVRWVPPPKPKEATK